MKPKSIFTPFQKLILFVFLSVILFFCAYYIHDLLLLIVLSFILAYLLTPVVDRLESLCRNRVVGILALYIFFFATCTVFIVYFAPVLSKELSDLSKNIPNYAINLKEYMFRLHDQLILKVPFLEQFKLLENIQSQIQKIVIHLTRSIPNLFFTILSTISYLTLMPIVLFLFLLQGSLFKKGFLKLVPNQYFESTVYLLYNIGLKLGNYLRGILLETAIVGCLSIFFLLVLNVDFAYILGLFAGIINIIPYVGPIIGAIPAIIVFGLKMKTFESVLSIAVLFFIVQLIDNVILKPVIYSQSVDLNPLFVLISLMIGGMLAGVWGLVLAVPIAGVIKLISAQIFKEIQNQRRKRYEQLI